jgi:hypothetical protein
MSNLSGIKRLNNFGFNVEAFPYWEATRKNNMESGNMVELNKNKKVEDKKKGKIPDFNVCAPLETGTQGVVNWQKIGVAWNNEKGISIILSALPLGNKIVLFVNEPKEE